MFPNCEQEKKDRIHGYSNYFNMWHLRTYHVVQTNLMSGNGVFSHLRDIPCKPRTDRNGLHLTCACCSFVHLLYSVPFFKPDVHGSVHRNINLIERTN